MFDVSSKCSKCSHSRVCKFVDEMIDLENRSKDAKVNEMFTIRISCSHYDGGFNVKRGV